MTDYTPSQQAAAAFASGELSATAAKLRTYGLDQHARVVMQEAAALMEIGGVRIAPEALAMLAKLVAK